VHANIPEVWWKTSNRLHYFCLVLQDRMAFQYLMTPKHGYYRPAPVAACRIFAQGFKEDTADALLAAAVPQLAILVPQLAILLPAEIRSKIFF
jgi:hypothetical protein